MIWVWSIVMTVALIIEIITVGNLVSIWFTVGGIFALGLALMNVPIIVQIVVFTVISGVCIILVRPLATQFLRGNITATNANSMIGQHVRLLKPISAESTGEVSINGIIWRTSSYNDEQVEAGVMITILAIEGATLIVKPIQ